MSLKKENKCKCFEDYPAWIILLSNLISLGIYIIGSYIMFQVGILLFTIYILYLFTCQFKVMKKSCINCYYYGKWCAFGLGKLSTLFFKKSKSSALSNKQVGWKDLLPDFLVSLVPIIFGVYILVQKFDLVILIFVTALFLLSSFGNSFVRRKLACKYCRQKELGCPAEKLFNKTKKKN
jgi:hypothetical protein